jgi:hypothetical protein
MRIKSTLLTVAALLVAAGIAYASFDASERQPVEFYGGHTHNDGETIGAPEHSGGTDKQGCHNASVPYYCH